MTLNRNSLSKTMRNPRFWILVALFVVGVIIHYPQHLLFGGSETQVSLLGLTRHTVERVYLLAPIIYAGFTFGIRGGIASLALSLSIMLPRAILISPNQSEALIESAGVIAIGTLVNLLFQTRRKEQERIRKTDTLLKAEDEKWRSSFNALEDIMMIIDRDYNIENINDSGLALLDKSRDEVIGRKCYEVLRNTNCPQDNCPCLHSCKTGEIGSLDHYSEHFGRFFSIKSSPIFNEKRGIIKFVDLMHDITDLKRAEEMLHEIIDGTSISSFVIDRHHKITYWNTAIEALTGIKRENIVGTNEQWRAFYSEKRPALADLIVDGASSEEIDGYYQGKCKKSLLIDGAYEAEDYYPALGKEGRWLQFTASPIKKRDGEIIAAIETMHDITERKKAEQALEESERSYRELFEVALDAIWVNDAEGNILKANEATEKLTGLNEKELAGSNIKDFLRSAACPQRRQQSHHYADHQSHLQGGPARSLPEHRP